MKKSISIIVVFVLLLTLLCPSCVSTPKSQNKTKEETASAQPNEKTGENTGAEAGKQSYELSHYVLEKSGNQWHLRFTDIPEQDGSMTGSTVAGISCSSVDELVSKIKTDNFTDGERKKIFYESYWDADGNIPVFDVDHPVYANGPSGFTVNSVTWYGTTYVFSIGDSEGNSFTVKWFEDAESFETFFDRQYVNQFKSTVTVSEPELQDGKSVFTVTTDRSVIKMVRYEPEPGVYVEEMYMIDTMGNEDLEDLKGGTEGLPFRIHMFNGSGPVRFTAFIEKPSRLFAAEDLLQFGVTK